MRLKVPEKVAGWISIGQAAHVEVEAFPGKTFTGTVARMSPSVDAQTRTLEVEALLKNADGQLKPGFFAKATIGSNQGDSALMVPEAAVRYVFGVYTIRENELHEQDELTVSLNLPEGTSITETSRVTRTLGEEVKKLKEVEFVNPYIPEGAMSHSHLYVRLVDIRARGRGPDLHLQGRRRAVPRRHREEERHPAGRLREQAPRRGNGRTAGDTTGLPGAAAAHHHDHHVDRGRPLPHRHRSRRGRRAALRGRRDHHRRPEPLPHPHSARDPVAYSLVAEAEERGFATAAQPAIA